MTKVVVRRRDIKEEKCALSWTRSGDLQTYFLIILITQYQKTACTMQTHRVCARYIFWGYLNTRQSTDRDGRVPCLEVALLRAAFGHCLSSLDNSDVEI